MHYKAVCKDGRRFHSSLQQDGLAMKVRTKAFVIICITLALLIGVCVGFFQTATYNRFLAIERDLFAASLDRTGNTLANEFEELQKIARDWGSWDATYDFIQDLNPDYVTGNLNFDSLQTLDVDTMVFLHLSGKIRFSKTYDLAAHEETRLAQGLSRVFESRDFHTWVHDQSISHQGFVRDGNGGICMFAAVPILDSSEKLPERGIFIVGRFFDTAHVQGIGTMLEVPISLISPDEEGTYPGIPGPALNELTRLGSSVADMSSEQAYGYVLLRDIFQAPLAALQIDLDRSISRQGHQAVLYAAGFFIFSSLVFLGVVLILLDRSILRRMNRIITQVRSITEKRDGSARVSLSGRDELAHLGNNLNAMLAALEEEQQKRKTAEAVQVMLTTAIEQLEDDVAIADAQGTIIYSNPALRERIAAFQGSGSLQAQRLKDLFDTSQHAEQARHSVNSGASWNGTCRWRRGDGTDLVLDVLLAPVAGNDADIVDSVCIRRDISEKVEIDKRLQLSRKMEALGSLAGGIAHDFNNILTSISGFTQLIGFSVDKDSRSHAYLDQILVAVKRAKDLIDRILSYSANKEAVGTMVSIDLHKVVDEALDLVKVSLPANVMVKQDIGEDLPRVRADAGQIHQIVINLCTNAGHAMKEHGGDLQVMLRRATPEDYATYHLAPHRFGYACLQIRDTGTGMTPEVRERIFDPFFTTKEPGEGTGLGLPMVHSIVTRMKGILHVASEPGKGSQFSLFFPSQEDGDIDQDDSSNENVQGSRERVLFVDDEQDVVYVAKEMLQILGYDVTATTDSRQAWKYFSDNPTRYDIVVTDLAMPHMDGRELIERILALTDQVPVLLCSGFLSSFDADTFVDTGMVNTLKKPYSSQELTREIQKLLHQHREENHR
jgi:signal transduction histidine kinase/sensor domain CHASE-containing protein/ActR/RegA family two-component response regulator